MIIVLCSDFWDGFALCKTLMSNEGLLLYAMTAQPRDSTYDSSICTYLVMLGNKSKDSMITKTTCTNNISNREDVTMPLKAC